MAIIFIAYVATSKLSEYIYFTFEISPAVLWPSLGLAVAAVYLGGYRVWPAIALAQFVTMATSAYQIPFTLVALSTVAYTIQPLLANYFLRRFGFNGSVSRTRDALLLIAVSLTVTIFAPAITTIGRALMDSLTAPIWISVTRGWAAGVLSILIVTPLITSWAKISKQGLGNNNKETLLIFTMLIGTIYLIFWTDFPQINTFVTLYALFAILAWVALRTSSRYMVLALFLVTTLGIAGVLLADTSDDPVGKRILSTQLFMMLVAPIYYVMAAVIEEHRRSQFEQKRYSRELEHALTKLAREDKTKSEFIAILAHELRNPLAPLMSTIELLRLRDPANKELWEPAYSQLLTMRRLLDDLLDVSRVAQNKFKLQPQVVNIKDVVRNSMNSVASHFAERHHTLTTDIQEGELLLVADPVRFEQILNNLLHNAAKYTDDGGNVTLRIRQTRTHTHAEVSDNGVGVEPELQKMIFEPFSQAREPQQFGTGLGIGLAITKRLVELHGGEISIISDGRGKGSTFTVTLPNEPLVDISDAELHEAIAASSDGEHEKTSMTSIRIPHSDTLSATSS